MALTAQTTSIGTRPISVTTDGPAIDEWLDRFDAIYEEAGIDCARTPWAHRKPNPAVFGWRSSTLFWWSVWQRVI